jgi:hypothetical protein
MSAPKSLCLVRLETMFLILSTSSQLLSSAYGSTYLANLMATELLKPEVPPLPTPRRSSRPVQDGSEKNCQYDIGDETLRTSPGPDLQLQPYICSDAVFNRLFEHGIYPVRRALQEIIATCTAKAISHSGVCSRLASGPNHPSRFILFEHTKNNKRWGTYVHSGLLLLGDQDHDSAPHWPVVFATTIVSKEPGLPKRLIRLLQAIQ